MRPALSGRDRAVSVISDKSNGSGLLCNQRLALASGAPVANNTSTLAVLRGQAHKNSTSGSNASVSLEQGPLVPRARSQGQVAAVSSSQGATQSDSNIGAQAAVPHQSQVQQAGIKSAVQTQGHATASSDSKRKRDPSPPQPKKRSGLILDKEDEDDDDAVSESDEIHMDLEEDEDLFLLNLNGNGNMGQTHNPGSSNDPEDENDEPDLAPKLISEFEKLSEAYKKFRWELRRGNIALGRYDKYVTNGIIPQDLNFKVKMSNPYPAWSKQYCDSQSFDELKAAEDAILLQAKQAIVQLRHQKLKDFNSLHQSQCNELFTRENILNELQRQCGKSKFPRDMTQLIDEAIVSTECGVNDLFKELDDRYQERLAQKSASKRAKPTTEEEEVTNLPPEPAFDWTSANSDQKIEFLYTNGKKQFTSMQKQLEKLNELEDIKKYLADIQKNLRAPRETGRSQPVHQDNGQRGSKRNQPSRPDKKDQRPTNKHNNKNRSYSEAARQAAPERQSFQQMNTSHRTVHLPNKSKQQPDRNTKSQGRGHSKPPPKPPVKNPAANNRGNHPRSKPPAQPTDWQEVQYKKNKKQRNHQDTLNQNTRVPFQGARK